MAFYNDLLVYKLTKKQSDTLAVSEVSCWGKSKISRTGVGKLHTKIGSLDAGKVQKRMEDC